MDKIRDVEQLHQHWPLVHRLLLFFEHGLGEGTAYERLDALLRRCALYPHSKVGLQSLVVPSALAPTIVGDIGRWSDVLVNVFRAIDIDSDARLVKLCMELLLRSIAKLSERKQDEMLDIYCDDFRCVCAPTSVASIRVSS